MRRVIGIDIHRTFGEVVIWENGTLRREGRVEMTRTALEGFGRRLERTDEVVIEATGNCMAVSRVPDGRVPGGSLIGPVKPPLRIWDGGRAALSSGASAPTCGRSWSSASGSVVTAFGGKVWPGSGVLSAVAARAPHVGVQVRTDRSGVRGRRPACVGAISSSPCVPAGRIRVARRRAPVVDCVLMRSPRRGRGCRCATWRAGSPPACAPGRPWPFAARCARRSRGPSRAGGMRRACAS